MREFYFKDNNANVAFRGLLPNADIDCLPFDFYRLECAYYSASLFQDVLKVKCPLPISDDLVREFVLKKTDELIEQMLSNSKPHPAIHQLLMDDTLSNKEQEKLLKDVILKPTDFLWLRKEAQDNGYLLDIYHEEKYPEKFKEKKYPLLYHRKKDCDIEKIGNTDMTDGEMRALLEQRKVIQAHIYHKKGIWHCFYFTFKGLSGEESGIMGSKPHYHYISNKSGIGWDDLLKRIKDCDMPSSKNHIVIER